jgi:hypothetical protein
MFYATAAALPCLEPPVDSTGIFTQWYIIRHYYATFMVNNEAIRLLLS